MANSESSLVKVTTNIQKVVGAVFDAIYYFIHTLINPNAARYRERPSRPNGGRIATLRPSGSRGLAPNMSIGGCRSCQM